MKLILPRRKFLIGAACLAAPAILRARPGPDSNYNQSVGGGGGSTATFDPANKFQITLSGGNLAATNSVGAGQFGNVRSTTSHSTGLIYIEWTMTGAPTGGVFIGLCNGSQSFASGFFGGGSVNAMILQSNVSGGNAGVLNLNGSANLYCVAPLATGDVDGWAINLPAAKVWARRNAGSGGVIWNNDTIGNQNPAVGSQVGGFDISSLGLPLFFFGDVETNAGTGTINTGGSPFAFGAPTGYGGGWT